MRVYKSSSFVVEFTGSRADAIKAACDYVRSLVQSDRAAHLGRRYTWRSEDECGFSIQVAAVTGYVSIAQKWNAARW